MFEERFGREFFRRFYQGRRRVANPRDYQGRAHLLAGYSAFLQLPVRRILEVGAGAGFFARALKTVFPRAHYLGTEVSAYACQRYGWRAASVSSIQAQPFDLVVCHDVLQYLARAEAVDAIENLARLTRGLLFCTVLTREDWWERCDQARTDGAVHLRSAAWYRQRLAVHFRRLGPGVYLSRQDSRVMFALDNAD